MRFFVRLLLNSIGVLAIAYIIPGFRVSGFVAALLFSLVLGLVNALVRPLVLLLTLPINIISLGLFTLVINGLLFWLAAGLSIGVQVESFAAALVGAILMWIVGLVSNSLFADHFEDEE